MSDLDFGTNSPQFREIHRVIQQLGSVVDRNARILNDVSQRVGALEELATALAGNSVGNVAASNDRVEVAREIIGSSAERMQKYLTAIIFGGYAAYFGFWTFLHGKVNAIFDASSGLLMLASMVAFFGFEIFKTISFTWYLSAEYLRIPKDADAMTAADAFIDIHKKGRAMDEKSIRWTKRQTIFATVPAAIAIITLATGYGWYLTSLAISYLDTLKIPQ